MQNCSFSRFANFALQSDSFEQFNLLEILYQFFFTDPYLHSILQTIMIELHPHSLSFHGSSDENGERKIFYFRIILSLIVLKVSFKVTMSC